jgi:uridine kinase
MENTSLLH